MIYVFLLLGLISFFDLKRLYKNCSKGQFIVVTLLFGGIIVVCVITASGTLLRSPIVIIGDLMKSIGLAYPPMS